MKLYSPILWPVFLLSKNKKYQFSCSPICSHFLYECYLLFNNFPYMKIMTILFFIIFKRIYYLKLHVSFYKLLRIICTGLIFSYAYTADPAWKNSHVSLLDDLHGEERALIFVGQFLDSTPSYSSICLSLDQHLTYNLLIFITSLNIQ